jgi:hypothetical protein
MSKAYVDTTVLSDVLLKPGALGAAARKSVSRYEVTELPEYAIKEFKAGPIKNFVWMHNKLASTGSFQLALNALQSVSKTPKRYTTATAIQALTDAADSISKFTLSKWVDKYGDSARIDSVLADECRLAIKTAIYKAWKKRRRVTTRVIQSLSCYKELDPYDARGLIVVEPTQCQVDDECCLAGELRAKPQILQKLRDALGLLPKNSEHERQRKVLRDLIRKPRQPMTEEMCRSLGDVVFAFFCPTDDVILTTNVRDHEPLARALGKSVEAP